MKINISEQKAVRFYRLNHNVMANDLIVRVKVELNHLNVSVSIVMWLVCEKKNTHAQLNN